MTNTSTYVVLGLNSRDTFKCKITAGTSHTAAVNINNSQLIGFKSIPKSVIASSCAIGGSCHKQ